MYAIIYYSTIYSKTQQCLNSLLPNWSLYTGSCFKRMFSVLTLTRTHTPTHTHNLRLTPYVVHSSLYRSHCTFPSVSKQTDANPNINLSRQLFLQPDWISANSSALVSVQWRRSRRTGGVKGEQEQACVSPCVHSNKQLLIAKSNWVIDWLADTRLSLS